MSATADTDVDTELNDIAGHLNAQHGRLVDVTARLLGRPDLWQGPGVWTPEQFLAWRTGVSPTRARHIVTVARRADELPVCVDALRRGELSLDQAATIANRAPWWTDTQICGLARNLTVAQLRRVVSQYRFPTIPNPDDVTDGSDAAGSDAADAESPGTTDQPALANNTTSEGDESGETGDHAPRDVCWFHIGDDDRFRLNLEADALTGKLIETALSAARDSLFHNGHGDVDWVDAVRELAQRSLDTNTEPAKRDRYRIALHLDITGTAVDTTGWTIPDAIRRHVTCDGLLDPIFFENGVPVSVGRRQRIIPERTRRLILLRDHGCRVPGCTNHRWLEVHHIIHWLDNGPTDTWNLVALCPHHHRLHHKHQLGITGNADDPDGVTFTFPSGDRITRSGARPEPPGAPPPSPSGTYQHPLGERLDARWLYFNPPLHERPHVEPPHPN